MIALSLRVASRTETLKMDDSTTYVVVGKLVASVDGNDHECGQLSLPVSEDDYRTLAPGSEIVFYPEYPGHLLGVVVSVPDTP